jgi:branched-chain amino acid transport system ATP-binding protein
MTILSVADLHTYYGDSHVLQGVTLDVEKGTVTAILGRNGVGKTTLCRSITGLTPARAGRVTLNGEEITRMPPHRVHRMGLGLVPQGRRIFSSLTVYENLAIALAPGSDIQQILAIFPRLSERLQNRGNELSGGEQQMLAIARALAAKPTVLIMDEPTEGLAPMMIAEVARVIRRLRDEGTTIILAEQNAAFAVKVADYAHVMSKGTVVHSTDPAALWADEAVKTQLLGVPAGGPTRARDASV